MSLETGVSDPLTRLLFVNGPMGRARAGATEPHQPNRRAERQFRNP